MSHLKLVSVRGEAVLICAGYCQRETGMHPGVMSKDERGDEGTVFFPDDDYYCDECDTDEFCWTYFKADE